MIAKNLKKFQKNKMEFNSIFKLQLQDYFSPMIGFDLMKFDDYLYQTFNDYIDGVSMSQIIELKYGTEAKDLILNLIEN